MKLEISLSDNATVGDVLQAIFPQFRVLRMGTLVELMDEHDVPKLRLDDELWDSAFDSSMSTAKGHKAYLRDRLIMTATW